MKTKDQHIEASKTVMQELRRFTRACRLQIIFNFFNIGLAVAIALTLISIVYKIIFHTLDIPIFIFAAFPVIFSLLSLLKPVKMKEVALMIDKKLKMKERLTTSLDFQDNNDSYTALLFHDTLKKIDGVKPQSLFPIRSGCVISLSALLCIMLLFYTFHDFTNKTRLKVHNVSLEVKSVIQKEGERLQKVADALKSEPTAGEESGQEVIKYLQALSEGLQSEDIDKHDALLMLSDAAQSIKELYLKKTGEPEDIGPADERMIPAENKIADDIKKTIDDLLDSIESAKQHIAEADTELGRRASQQETDKNSLTNNLLNDAPASGMTGETRENAAAPGNAVSISSSLEKITTSELHGGAERTKDLEFPAGSIILNYPDGVISLESLPKRYHKIVKDYFDAVSGS